jgi:hypothetical protein
MFDVVDHTKQTWNHVLSDFSHSSLSEKVECGVEALAVVAAGLLTGKIAIASKAAEAVLPEVTLQEGAAVLPRALESAVKPAESLASSDPYWLKAPVDDAFKDRLAQGNQYSRIIVDGISTVDKGQSIVFQDHALRMMGKEGFTGSKAVDLYKFAGRRYSRIIQLMEGVPADVIGTAKGPEIHAALEKFTLGQPLGYRETFSSLQNRVLQFRPVTNMENLNFVEDGMKKPWLPGEPPRS